MSSRTITYWRRIKCRWVRVTTDMATWRRLPHVTLGAGCTLAGVAALGAGLALAPTPPPPGPTLPATDASPALLPARSGHPAVGPLFLPPGGDARIVLVPPVTLAPPQGGPSAVTPQLPPQAVPEPASWLLLLFPALGLIALARMWRMAR